MLEASATRLGHVGLFVSDMPRMVDFYRRVLGFVVTDAGATGSPTFLSRSAKDHHQVVLVAGRDSGTRDMVQQLSFNLGSLEAVQQAFHRIADSDATDLRPITHGIAWSIYFRDPEGNRIEMFADTDWYVPQPCAVPIDLGMPASQLRSETEAYCRAQPGFLPLPEWQADFARKMAAAG
jgi:catechol-2,3-dioxygenase